MGNSNSSVLSTKLHELGDLACQLGDNSFGRSLKAISGSPDDIKSLRAVVAAEINRSTQISSRKKWFQNFTSDDGKKLSGKEVDSLASITSGWELNSETLKAAQKDVSKWSRAPSTFFPSHRHVVNPVQEAYEDIENIEEADQPRRKFRLIKLNDILRAKEEKLRSTYKRNWRRHGNNEKQNEGKTLRSRALAEIVKETWGPLSPEMLKKKKEKLAKYCRAGGRWAGIKYKEVILALRNTNNKSFERKRLSDLQLIAINSFVSSMFSEEVRTELRRAYKAIEKHISRMSRKRKASSTRPTNKRVRRDGVSHAPDPSDASGCYEQQDSEGQSEPDCDDTFSDATSQSTSSDIDGFVEGEVEGDISTERDRQPTGGQVTSSDRDQDTDSHRQTSPREEFARLQNPTSHDFSVAVNGDSNQPRLQVSGSTTFPNVASNNPANVDMSGNSAGHNISTSHSNENDTRTLIPNFDHSTARPATARQTSKRQRSNTSSRPPRKKQTEQIHHDGRSSHASYMVPRPAGGLADSEQIPLGSYVPRSSGNVPQIPTSFVPNTQRGNLHPINTSQAVFPQTHLGDSPFTDGTTAESHWGDWDQNYNQGQPVAASFEQTGFDSTESHWGDWDQNYNQGQPVAASFEQTGFDKTHGTHENRNSIGRLHQSHPCLVTVPA